MSEPFEEKVSRRMQAGGEVSRIDILELIAEIRRLKRGDFTDAELQNFCHNLGEDDECSFKAGCEAYQIRLFGLGAVEDERAACLALVEEVARRIRQRGQK